jgi:hypothetical protein
LRYLPKKITGSLFPRTQKNPADAASKRLSRCWTTSPFSEGFSVPQLERALIKSAYSIAWHAGRVRAGKDLLEGVPKPFGETNMAGMQQQSGGDYTCGCGAVYKVTITTTPFPDTDSESCEVCGN